MGLFARWNDAGPEQVGRGPASERKRVRRDISTATKWSEPLLDPSERIPLARPYCARETLQVSARALLRRAHLAGWRHDKEHAASSHRTTDGRRASSKLCDSVVFLCGHLYYWNNPLPETEMTEQAEALATEKEARDVAESARETEWEHPSFARELFLGRFRLDLIHPHPEEDPEEAARAKPFMDKLADFMASLNSEEIDRTGEIPESVIQELREMGAFGIKIPREYGGLGLSQMTYIRAIELVTSKDGSLVALLSASQSIGVPQPLKLFGTEEQKRKYFPRLAKGRIS